MGGILDFLKNAVPLAATARVGYEHGQDEEADRQAALKRQSLIDQMKQKLDQSSINENNARADYYRDGGAGGDAVEYVKDGTGNYVALPKKIKRGAGSGSGGSGAGSLVGALKDAVGSSDPEQYGDDGDGAAFKDAVGSSDPEQYGDDGDGAAFKAPKSPDATDHAAGSAPASTSSNASTSLGVPTGVSTPKPATRAPTAPRISKSSEVDPVSGKVNDVFSDGSRKYVRDATPEELERARRVPAVKAPGTGGAKPMNPKTTESYLQSVADRAVAASNGDVRAAAAQASQDPDGLEAYSHGLATRHFDAAKQKYDRQQAIDADVHPTMDPAAAAGPPPKSGAPAKPAKSSGVLQTVKDAVSPSAPPPNTPSARPTKPAPSGNVDLRGDGASSIAPGVTPRTASSSDDEATAEIVLKRIAGSGGKITPQQALQSPSLSPAVKAIVRAHFGLPTQP